MAYAYFIELDDGKIYRKALYFDGKTHGFPVDFPLNQSIECWNLVPLNGKSAWIFHRASPTSPGGDPAGLRCLSGRDGALQGEERADCGHHLPLGLQG